MTQRMQQMAIHAMDWTRIHLRCAIVGAIGVLLLIIIGLCFSGSVPAQFTSCRCGAGKGRVKNPGRNSVRRVVAVSLASGLALIAGAVWLMLLGFARALCSGLPAGVEIIIAMVIVLVCLALALLLVICASFGASRILWCADVQIPVWRGCRLEIFRRDLSHSRRASWPIC